MDNTTQNVIQHFSSFTSGQLITYQQLLSLALSVSYMSSIVLSLGVVLNFLNMATFVLTGLQDGVTVSFFLLSTSDFAYDLISLTIRSCVVLTYSGQTSIVTCSEEFQLVAYWHSLVFYDYSVYVTAFIALVRCCCVAMPLRFKNQFTVSRTLCALCLFFIAATILRTPALIAMTLRNTPSPNQTSALELWNNLRIVNDTLNRNIIPLSCFIIIFLCLIILSIKLFSASNFRQTMTAPKQSKNSRTSWTKKDLRVVQSVTLISTLFVTFTLPFVVCSLTRTIYPAMFESDFLLNGLIELSQLLGFVNSSFNFFIYFRYKKDENSMDDQDDDECDDDTVDDDNGENLEGYESDVCNDSEKKREV
ncbi:uncharacterized protein LOC131955007 [Physella acuta]|uniref:uncharacterized protein LOC131955007 n=1 Tax=Physella acuta TaxID=109671 RepID=UPI0027DD2A96|nr:uncharacterized protein LOC131955007 [Physella acuta]